MKNKQKGSGNIFILVVAIVILAVAGWYLLKGRTTTSTMNPNQQNTASSSNQAIQSDSDLQKASQDLDNTNIDGTIDPELNQNDTDAQTFAPRIRLKNGASTNWSGYAVESNLANPQNKAVSDVKGTWVVPGPICTGANTYAAAWVGIDGYNDNSVEQTGTEQDCSNGNPKFYAWYEMYPKPSFRVNLPVKAGDTINAEVKYTSGNQFVLTLANATTNQSFTIKQNAKAQRQSAEWIVEAPWSGGVLPLANFGTIPFSNAHATLNNVSGTISNWSYDAITMESTSGTVKAVPSSLSSDGTGFTVTWNSSN